MPDEFDFNAFWRTYIVPLRGRRVMGPHGVVSEIIRVDPTGIERTNRNDMVRRHPIQPFRWTVERVFSGRPVTRAAYEKKFSNRHSTAVFMVLEMVPLFEVSRRPTTIRLRDKPGVSDG